MGILKKFIGRFLRKPARRGDKNDLSKVMHALKRSRHLPKPGDQAYRKYMEKKRKKK